MADSNRNSASSFSLMEEEFFRAGTLLEPSTPESFADLDDGYRPASFWRRLFGFASNRSRVSPT